MSPLENLKALMAKATPLYPNPSVYFDKKTDESVANLFSRDTPGECVVQVRGDYAREWAKALVALPDLLAVVSAADALVAIEKETDDYVDNGPTDHERLMKLLERKAAALHEIRHAVAKLTTTPQKDA